MPLAQYIKDSEVDAEADRELRQLLSTCFTKPQDHVFQTRRYFNEPPAHRWVIRTPAGMMCAHLALHEKQVFVNGKAIRVGGVAEVCVLPEQRGRGHLHSLITAAHEWMRKQGIAFSLLSGNPRYYASSGYVEVENLFRENHSENHPPPWVPFAGGMVACLGEEPWPQAKVLLPGPAF